MVAANSSGGNVVKTDPSFLLCFREMCAARARETTADTRNHSSGHRKGRHRADFAGKTGDSFSESKSESKDPVISTFLLHNSLIRRQSQRSRI